MKKTIKLRLITAAVGLAMAAGMVYAAGNQKAGAARKAKPGFTKVKLMTGQKKKITLLVQEVSILKNRVNDLEEKKGE